MEVTQDPGQQLYPGLYGEVVTEDCYGLRYSAANHEPPDVIFDIWANVGIFTRFAREVFPDAFIVAVEPDPLNRMKFNVCTDNSDGIQLLRAAIGLGDIWKASNAPNGPHEMYVSAGPGYSQEWLKNSSFFHTGTESIRLCDLVQPHASPHQRYLVKVDCEGNEIAIFGDAASMETLAGADYFAIEIHTCAAHGGAPLDAVKQLLQKTYERLEKTHEMVVEHTIWKGIRRA